jgi:hypothetical protein
LTAALAVQARKAAATLQEQASLLNQTHDSIFVRDMNDVITYWNGGATPTPPRIAAHVRDAPLSNPSCQHPADPVPPNPDRLVANSDRALGQQVPVIAERQRLFAYIITSGPITLVSSRPS